MKLAVGKEAAGDALERRSAQYAQAAANVRNQTAVRVFRTKAALQKTANTAATKSWFRRLVAGVQGFSGWQVVKGLQQALTKKKIQVNAQRRVQNAAIQQLRNKQNVQLKIAGARVQAATDRHNAQTQKQNLEAKVKNYQTNRQLNATQKRTVAALTPQLVAGAITEAKLNVKSDMLQNKSANLTGKNGVPKANTVRRASFVPGVLQTVNNTLRINQARAA